MADKENDDKDLGFFNGIRSELIPLAAGLVSFSILVDKAVNDLGKYFGLKTHISAIVFVLLYFVLPVLSILLWLTWFNHKEGLKRMLIEQKGLYRFCALATIILIAIAAVGFINLDLIPHIVITTLALIAILVYGFSIDTSVETDNTKYARQFRQAKLQYHIVTGCLLLIWGCYYYNQFYPSDKAKEIAFVFPFEFFRVTNKIDTASALRKQVDTARSRIDTLKNQTDRLNYLAECDPDRAEQLKTLLSKNLCVSSDTVVNLDRKLEAYRYQLQAELIKHEKKAKQAWAGWLRLVQFKGLLLLIVLILFLLAIWYHAYTAKLVAKMQSEKDKTEMELFSEINISRLSIYMLFLLIIPFFKPIDEQDVNFDKPFISEGNPITLINYGNKVQVIEKEIPVPDTEILKENLEQILGEAGTIREQQKIQKKEPAKPNESYDKKPIH